MTVAALHAQGVIVAHHHLGVRGLTNTDTPRGPRPVGGAVTPKTVETLGTDLATTVASLARRTPRATIDAAALDVAAQRLGVAIHEFAAAYLDLHGHLRAMDRAQLSTEAPLGPLTPAHAKASVREMSGAAAGRRSEVG